MPDIEPIDVVEALLFASDTPVEAERIQEVLGLASAAEAREVVEALRRRLELHARGLQVVEVGGGFRLVTRPEAAPWLVKLARSRTRSRLSRPALETLAIVAYRQPVSRPEVDAIRGVNSEGVLENLLDRRMIRMAGRKDSPGRPFLYETTREFLVAFGLRDLSDLPKVEGELIMPEPAAGEVQPDLTAGGLSAGDQPREALGTPTRGAAVDEPTDPIQESARGVEPSEDDGGAVAPRPVGGPGGGAAVAPPQVEKEKSAGADSPDEDPCAGRPGVSPGR